MLKMSDLANKSLKSYFLPYPDLEVFSLTSLGETIEFQYNLYCDQPLYWHLHSIPPCPTPQDYFYMCSYLLSTTKPAQFLSSQTAHYPQAL